MKWPGEDTLILKKGVKVMLVWNKSETLKNGSVGTFEGVTNDGMALVNFEEEGTVLIGRETWVNRNVKGEWIGAVCQYPLVVAYAVTCHKSQDLTMPATIVHCTNEFVSGLIYVAASRVTSANNLQLLNFKPEQLMKPPLEVTEQCSKDLGYPEEDLSCCRYKLVSEDGFFSVKEMLETELDLEDEELVFPAEQVDETVGSYFEISGVQEPVQLNVVYDQLMRHESELAKPPGDLFSKAKVDEVLIS